MCLYIVIKKLLYSVYLLPFLFLGNRFSCDCRLDWVYVLRDKTTQSNVRNSLEELQCQLQPEDKVATTAETYENIGCPPLDRTFAFEAQFPDAKENADDPEDEESGNKVYLTSIPLADLPCPPEFRPTPITIKQGTTRRPETSRASSSEIRAAFLVVLFVFLM